MDDTERMKLIVKLEYIARKIRLMYYEDAERSLNDLLYSLGKVKEEE